MLLNLRKERLKRYRDLGRLFLRYGRAGVVRRAGDEELPDDDQPEIHKDDPRPEQLADDLEKLGPTFVKLGQLLSTRADLLPVAYMDALSRLQNDVAPFPFVEVERIVTTELGVRLSKAFSHFDPEPLAAASLGQVHRASLRDGRPVAVKVQRPGIREQMVDDLDAIGRLSDFLEKHTRAGRRYEYGSVTEEFRRMLLRELDYRQEARNLLTLGENLTDFPRIFVPRALDDYTTSKVLTTEYVKGHKITALSPLMRTEIDGRGLSEELFRAYLKQVLVDGFVHADPHPGNVILTDDDRIALIDLGMVAHFAPQMQERLLQLMLAIAEGRSDEAGTLALKIGEPRESFDEIRFRRRVDDLVTQNREADVEQLQVGRVVLMISRIAGECGVRVPSELALLGKTLMNLDQVGRALDPGFDPNEGVRRYAAQLTQQRMRKSISPGHVYEVLMEGREFLQKLPLRVNKILENIAENNIQVKVDAIDEKVLMAGFQKIANRITLGLVLAALIVGAAQLMRVETSFRLLGYPGLAIICFLGAAGGAIGLMIDILFSDEKNPRKGVDSR